MTLTLRQARLLLISLTALFSLICAISAAMLLSPASRSISERSKAAEQLRAELDARRKDNQPLINIEGKLISAHEQIGQFRMANTTGTDSELSEHLHKLAEGAHVKLVSAGYSTQEHGDKGDTSDLNQAGLRSTSITLHVIGGYEQLLGYVNALERSEKLFIVEDVQFQAGDKATSGGLSINILTYIRKEQL